MAATDQQIVDAARDSLLAIIEGRSEEFREASESVKTIEIQRLTNVITTFEARVAAASGIAFRQIREVDI
jgi:hypothetical protein